MEELSQRAIRKDLMKMIFPVLMTSMLEMSVGFVSMALIGNLGGFSIGAMGLSTRVRGLVWSVYKGIGIGVQVVVAQATGQEDHQKVKDATQQTIISVGLISLFLLLTILKYPQYWLGIFGARGEALEVSIRLLRVIAVGFPFFGTVIVISGALQGRGDATTPMVINGIMNILNIILGLILVRGLFGAPELGLMGAGYAMTISQVIGAVIAIGVILNKKDLLKGASLKSFFTFKKTVLTSIYRTGIPSVLESLFWNVSSIIMIRAIMEYGESVFEAYQLGLQTESLAYMPAAGFQIAATAYVGKFIGANSPEKARAYFREILKWAVVISAIGGGMLVLIPSVLLGIMTNDLYLIQVASVYLIFCGLAQIPQNVAGVLGGALRGAGYTNVPMISAGIGIYGLRVPIALLAAYVMNWSVNIVFLAIALDMCLRLVLNGWFYYKIKIYDNPRIV